MDWWQELLKLKGSFTAKCPWDPRVWPEMCTLKKVRKTWAGTVVPALQGWEEGKWGFEVMINHVVHS